MRLCCSFVVGAFLLVLAKVNAQRCNPPNIQPSPTNGLPSCSLPADDYASGRPIPGSATMTPTFPPWMNLTLARIGQAFAYKNFFSMGFAAYGGLLSGLAMPDQSSVLAHTGHTADATDAIPRYVATITQFQVWMQDLFCTDPLDISVVTSIGHVKDRHIAAAASANAIGLPYAPANKYDSVATDDAMWSAVAADLAASSLTVRTFSSAYGQFNTTTTAINQFIQGLTQMTFFSQAIISPSSVYIWNATDEELRGVLEMWAVLGWILGVEDDYNVGLQPDPVTAAAYLRELHEKYLFPAWFNIDHTSKVMIEVVLNNYNRYFSAAPLTTRTIMVKVLRDVFGIGTTNLENTLTFADKSVLWNYDNVFAPSTHAEATRQALNNAVDSGLQAGIVAAFGPYFTYAQKAEHVHYPSVPGG